MNDSSVQKSKKKSNSAGKHTPAKYDGPMLTLSIGGTKEKVPIVKLNGDEFVAGLQKECDKSKEPAKVWITHLLDLQDKDRWDTLDFIATLKNCRILVAGNGYNDLFDAVLALPVDALELKSVRSWKMAALEAAVIRYPDALDVACSRMQERLREIKIKGVKTADLLKDARKIAAQLQAGANAQANSSQS